MGKPKKCTAIVFNPYNYFKDGTRTRVYQVNAKTGAILEEYESICIASKVTSINKGSIS